MYCRFLVAVFCLFAALSTSATSAEAVSAAVSGPTRPWQAVRPDAGASDYAKECYIEPLPSLEAAMGVKSVPWDVARGLGGCCSSLAEIRVEIDGVDSELLRPLAQRAALVREATRFKATRDTVDVPARDEEVINRAVNGSVEVQLPQVIAHAVFTAIINSSVAFELCVFDSYDGGV